jgi:steroid 5-alpha reductase family enzyme
VGELVRDRARRDDRAPGLGRLGRPCGLLFLLFRVTGIPATERQALRSRADYAEYQRTTSAFVPLPPRRATT